MINVDIKNYRPATLRGWLFRLFVVQPTPWPVIVENDRADRMRRIYRPRKGITPKVAISSAHPRVPERFARALPH